MSATERLGHAIPVAGLCEGITAGPKTSWARATGGDALTSAVAAQAVAGGQPRESHDHPDSSKRWQYLVARPHHWRKQLSLKERNLTVGQLVSTLKANQLTAEQASVNLDLPRAAIDEALAYYAENRTLIEEEAEAERRWLKKRGYPLEPTAHLP
jgi:hypothetical protein